MWSKRTKWHELHHREECAIILTYRHKGFLQKVIYKRHPEWRLRSLWPWGALLNCCCPWIGMVVLWVLLISPSTRCIWISALSSSTHCRCSWFWTRFHSKLVRIFVFESILGFPKSLSKKHILLTYFVYFSRVEQAMFKGNRPFVGPGEHIVAIMYDTNCNRKYIQNFYA